MANKPIKIALLGLGTVGTGVYKLLSTAMLEAALLGHVFLDRKLLLLQAAFRCGNRAADR